MNIQLRTPKPSALWLSVMLVVAGLIGTVVPIRFVSQADFALLFVGYLVLLAGALAQT